MKVMRATKKFVVKQVRMPDGLSSAAGVTIHEGEHVLFIGSINNMNGTVAISEVKQHMEIIRNEHLCNRPRSRLGGTKSL